MKLTQHLAQLRAQSPAQALFEAIDAAVRLCGADDPAIAVRVPPHVSDALAYFKPPGPARTFEEMPVTVGAHLPDCVLAEITTRAGRTVLVEL